MIALLLSDTDKRVAIIAVVIAIVAFFLIAAIGIAVRRMMIHQSKRADSMMYDVVKTHVVTTTSEFRRLGGKKNARAFYRDSLLPFSIALLGVLIYLIANLATGKWGENIFANFGELFIQYDWHAEGVWTKVFGMTLLASWPPVSHQPTFVLPHLPDYIECVLFIVAMALYLYACFGYISRFFLLNSRSRSVFEKSLAGYNANEDIKVDLQKPIPPSE